MINIIDDTPQSRSLEMFCRGGKTIMARCATHRRGAMMKTLRALFLTVLSVAILGSLVAQAQSIPKSGSFSDARSGWSWTGKFFPIDESHNYFWGAASGTLFLDEVPGFMAGGTDVCPGAGLTINGEDVAMGYCVATDADGDKNFLIWHRKGTAGTWKYLGGTGKYAGLTGGGELTFSSALNFNLDGNDATAQGMTRATGKYSIP